MSKEKLQEKYVLYQLLQQNLETLRQQLEMVERQFIETKTTEQVFKDLKSGKGNDDVLIPLGSGCYGKGRVMDTKNFLVGVGANIMTQKTMKSAELFLQERERELENASREIQEHMSKVANQIDEIATEIQAMVKKDK